MLEAGLGAADNSAGLEAVAARQTFGNYELLEEIARGGMGVVFKARQISLHRLVALKMILRGEFAAPAELARFRAEAETAAQLQHPNIVAIHEVGERDGQPFFCMDLVEGRNLAEVVANTPLAPRRAANYLKTVAGAVHYAHSRGVLHRDLKPSNVLIDADDQPRVTDFGLAKRLDRGCPRPQRPRHANANEPAGAPSPSESAAAGASRAPDPSLTHTGQVLGSPNFMPPEQAAGNSANAGPASDVYSLGAMLYHTLTGRPPFLAETLTATLRLVAESEPIAPRSLVPTVPLDLETICLKCLAKEPSRRYGTAQELADELGRFLRDEPILARPAGRAEKFWRWCRRHPAMASVSAVAALLLAAVAIISTTMAARLQRANREGQEKLRESLLAQARATRWSGHEGRRFDALEAIRQATTIRPGLDLRNEAIAALALVDLRPEREWPVSDRGMMFDTSFERYVHPDTNGAMVVRRTADDTELMRLPSVGLPPFEFYFSPDGRLLAVHYRHKVEYEYAFKLYDLTDSGKVTLDLPDRWVRHWSFSPDGRRLVVVWKEAGRTIARNFTVTFFDLTTAQELNSFTTSRLSYGAAFSPDASQFALSSTESTSVRIHAVPDGRVLRALTHSNGVYQLSWSADGRHLASACADGHVYLWDMSVAPPSPRLLPHDSVVTTCVFTLRGDRLMSFGWNSLAKLWEVQTGRELLRVSCDGFGGFSADGRRVLLHRRPETIGISEFAVGEECRPFTFGSRPVGANRACLSPDGRWMASSHRDGLRLWDLATGRESHYDAIRETTGLEFTPDGSALVSLATNQTIVSWPIRVSVENGTNRIAVGPPTPLRSGPAVAGHPTNRMLQMVRDRAFLFDAASLTIERILTTPSGFFSGTLSPDGRYCATWRRDTGIVDVWDAGDGRHLATPSQENSNGVGFSPDSRWLVTSTAREYTVWEFGSWVRRRTIPRSEAGGTFGKVAFTPDGQVMALSRGRGEVDLFDATTFELLARLEPQAITPVSSLDFSADGAQLAVGTTANTIYLWDLRLVRRQLAELGLDWDAPPLPPAPSPPGPLELRIIAP
jgi:serine/threonine protein kinase/WD40 repeat protein